MSFLELYRPGSNGPCFYTRLVPPGGGPDNFQADSPYEGEVMLRVQVLRCAKQIRRTPSVEYAPPGLLNAKRTGLIYDSRESYANAADWRMEAGIRGFKESGCIFIDPKEWRR